MRSGKAMESTGIATQEAALVQGPVRSVVEAMVKGGEAGKRAFAAMTTMQKIAIAAMKAAVYADA
jgi:hypothetical protein